MECDIQAGSQHDVVIIGAGQAGLAMGALLQHQGIDYLIVGEEPRIGDTWRTRYDALRLFTPRWLNRLPMDNLGEQTDLAGYPGKNEVAHYLEDYAQRKQLQVALSTRVTRLSREGAGFVLETPRGRIHAGAVVIATGPFQKPSIPQFASKLAPRVTQLHTAQYRNARQLQAGRVLVVGAGNSGAQIAVELARHRDVHLSTGERLTFVPQTLLGKSIFWWFSRLGVYRAHVATSFGRRLSQRPDPIIGRELKRCLRDREVVQHPRTVDAKEGRVSFVDGSTLHIDNIIWATGYQPDYSWLEIAGALDDAGKPRHRRGVSDLAGLYFLGLPWQHSRKSALIGGVGDDARYILPVMQKHLRGSRARTAQPEAAHVGSAGGCQTV